MLYKDGELLDLQGNKIKPQAVRMVEGYRRRALREATKGENAFMRLISPLGARAKVYYVKQVVFYVAPTISFRSDFVFRDHRLIVEIDGSSHSKKSEKDAWRDDVLLRLGGYRTLRFSNEDCLERYCYVRLRVLDALCDSEKGYKKLIRQYRDDLLGTPEFMAAARDQNPGRGSLKPLAVGCAR